MTVTSFDRTAAWLGRTWWRRLHLAGSYLIWLIFLQSYAGRGLREPISFAGPTALALIFALALRVGVRLRRPGGALGG